jgi:hypothetical protein
MVRFALHCTLLPTPADSCCMLCCPIALHCTLPSPADSCCMLCCPISELDPQAVTKVLQRQKDKGAKPSPCRNHPERAVIPSSLITDTHCWAHAHQQHTLTLACDSSISCAHMHTRDSYPFPLQHNAARSLRACAHTHTHIHTYTHARAHTRARAHTHTHTHARTHAVDQARTSRTLRSTWRHRPCQSRQT